MPTKQTPKEKSKPAPTQSLGPHLALITDLSQSILVRPALIRQVIRDMDLRLKKLSRAKERFIEFERPWILRLWITELNQLRIRHHLEHSRFTNAQDAASRSSQTERLKGFPAFFRRLRIEDQILLLLRDRHGLDFDEIATALEQPAESLKLRRQQAYRALEEWIWE